MLDALAAGFATTVLTDAVAAVDVAEGDGQRALDEMVAAGARLAVGSGRWVTECPPGQSARAILAGSASVLPRIAR